MDTTFCLIVMVLALAAIFYIFWNSSQQAERRRKALQQAEMAYRQSLAKLKAEPTNATLKEQTLALGRRFSALGREQKAATTYDELAMMNDINAATAGAVAAPTRATVEDRLKQLDDLRTRGLVTEAEYADRRRAILGDV